MSLSLLPKPRSPWARILSRIDAAILAAWSVRLFGGRL